MKDMVNSATGPVALDDLGIILPHEHLLFARDERLPFLKQELIDYKNAGGSVIIDMSTPEICKSFERDERIDTLYDLAQETGVTLMYGTGFYKEPRLPEFIKEKTIDELAEMMIHEIEVGRGKRKIKASLIAEVGSSNYTVYETEEKVLRAAGRASAKTGVAITTHTGRGTMYKEQLRFFEEEGADLTRVAIGHQDVYPRLEERMEAYEYIFSKGATVQFDCIGKRGFFEIHLDIDYGQKFPYDEDRAKMIKKFVDMGYIRQIMISCDIDGPTLCKHWGGWGYSHMLTSFVPMLKKEGLTDEQIHQIMVENPKSMLRRKVV